MELFIMQSICNKQAWQTMESGIVNQLTETECLTEYQKQTQDNDLHQTQSHMHN